MDSTIKGPPTAREKAAAIRHVAPARPPLVRGEPPLGPAARSSFGWKLLVFLAYLLGAAALAAGAYVYYVR
jgi:hypothetical protein